MEEPAGTRGAGPRAEMLGSLTAPAVLAGSSIWLDPTSHPLPCLQGTRVLPGLGLGAPRGGLSQRALQPPPDDSKGAGGQTPD